MYPYMLILYVNGLNDTNVVPLNPTAVRDSVNSDRHLFTAPLEVNKKKCSSSQKLLVADTGGNWGNDLI